MVGVNFDRFVSVYNEIHKFLCQELGVDERTGFREVVREFSSSRSRFEGVEELNLFADLRNLAVHAQDLIEPVFEPSDKAIEQIEALRDRLKSQPTARERYRRPVVTVSSDTPLSHVLALVRSNRFSQFPIYDDGQFKGLVTENALIRWLANHVSEAGTLIELGDHCVDEVQSMQEHRRPSRLIAADTPVDVVESMFADSPTLEAVIVTHSGKPHEEPIGIATTWDIARE